MRQHQYVASVGHRIAAGILITFAIAGFGWEPALADESRMDRLFDPSRVIEISIEMPVKSWDELRKQNRNPAQAFGGAIEQPFDNFKANVTVDGIEIGEVAVRKKGFLGSLDDNFPSLKIKFDEYQDQSPIPGLDGLTLNNNKQDTSLLSQFLAYRLFNASGVYAPRSNFARVTVNGNYLGVYSNVESIGKPFLERRFGNKSGNLYEGTLADFYPKAIDRIEAKTNKKNHDRTKITRLATLLAAKEDLPLDEIERMIDVESFLRFWALESLIVFWDGYSNNQNNYWVYDNPANGKFYFMPWGADATLMAGGFPGFGPATVYAEAMLTNRLYQNKQISDRYRETMTWLLANVWNEADLLKTIDQMEEVVKPHLHSRQKGATRATNSVRNFVKSRRQVIEKDLANWPVRVSPQPRKPTYVVPLGTASGHFSTVWNDNAPTQIETKGQVNLKLDFQDKPVEWKQIGASVHRQANPGFPFPMPGPPGQAGPPMATIAITGLRNSDQKRVTLTFNIDQKVLTERIGVPQTIRGSFSEGGNGGSSFGPFSRFAITGTVTFAKAGTHPNDAIEGDLDVSIAETRGGFMNRPPGGPGGGPFRGGPFGMGGGNPPWSPVVLLNLKEVQEELSMTDDQRKQIREIQQGFDEANRANEVKMREAFEGSDEQRMELFQSVRKTMEQLNQSANGKIDTMLEIKQRERLKQLQIQREGIGAFARPEIVKELKLSEDQQERIREIQRETQFAGPFGQDDERRRQSFQEILSILDSSQNEQWASIKGKDFRFPNPPPFPGRFPGPPPQ